MITVNVTATSLTATADKVLTEGLIGEQCRFSFSADWDGLTKEAVFEGVEAASVILFSGDTVTIPPQVFHDAVGYSLRISVIGRNANGEVVIPTVWGKAGKIQASAASSEYKPTEWQATPGAVAQIIEKAGNAELVAQRCEALTGRAQEAAQQSADSAEDARAIAQSVRDDADAGKFQGPQGEPGPQGVRGNSGVHIGHDEPTDQDINVWIDTGDDVDMFVVTDLKKFTYVGQYFANNGGYNDYHSGYLASADWVHVFPGSTLSTKSSAVQFRLIIRLPGETRFAEVLSNLSGTYTFDQECDIRMCFHYQNKRPLYNNKVLEEFDARLIMKEEPVKFKRKVFFVDSECPLFEPFEISESDFNADTSYETIISAFDALVEAHPRALFKRLVPARDCTDEQITADDVTLPLYELRVGNAKNDTLSKQYRVPTVVLICSQHGWEKLPTYGAYHLLKALLEEPTSSRILMWLRTKVNIVVVPAVNPAGWQSKSRNNSNHINLNRNWATYNWDEYLPVDDDGNPTYLPGGYNAKGDSPCSEPETKILTKIVKRYGHAVAVFDLHMNGQFTEQMDQLGTVKGCEEVSPDKILTYLRDYVSNLKPFMDSEFFPTGTELDYDFYGRGALVEYRPSLSAAGPDVIGIPSYLLESCPGGGSLLAEFLPSYSADCKRYVTTMIANLIVQVIKMQNAAGLIGDAE